MGNGFIIASPLEVPARGFELVDGIISPIQQVDFRGTFLVPRPGQSRRVTTPIIDIFSEALVLRPDTANVLKFANCYGSLGLRGRHFHKASGEPASGELSADWSRAICRLQRVADLFFSLREGDQVAVATRLEKVLKVRDGAFVHPFERRTDDFGFGADLVRLTINAELSVRRFDGPCVKCDIPAGCERETGAVFSQLTSTGLAMSSRGLEKSLWLHLAEVVAGYGEHFRRCEICGETLDLRGFARPGAHRSHGRCQERLKKQKKRSSPQI